MKFAGNCGTLELQVAEIWRRWFKFDEICRNLWAFGIAIRRNLLRFGELCRKLWKFWDWNLMKFFGNGPNLMTLVETCEHLGLQFHEIWRNSVKFDEV